MINVVVGGLGFVGKHLVDLLMSRNEEYLIVDIGVWGTLDKNNLKRGATLIESKNWAQQVRDLVGESDIFIWHLAANSDISKSSQEPSIDFDLTLGSTLEVYKLARMSNCVGISFTSSSAIYGVSNDRKFIESDCPNPISAYGVMKTASENLLKVISLDLKIPIHIFRLANIVGPHMTHGVIIDFIKKLKLNPSKLEVLGDGNQTKGYLHVEDLVRLMFKISQQSQSTLTNLGPYDDGVKVSVIAKKVASSMMLNPQIVYEQKNFGWFGDVPISLMDTSHLVNKYNTENLTSLNAIEKAIKENL